MGCARAVRKEWTQRTTSLLQARIVETRRNDSGQAAAFEDEAVAAPNHGAPPERRRPYQDGLKIAERKKPKPTRCSGVLADTQRRKLLEWGSQFFNRLRVR